ncbi:hypothetical protein AMATHDRAFT_60111 [Amanita thiersii Skay4041]|uniref:START domain-containing protein n=1 Tax=Amanita thiersii Skay4041 TaxID=703135 RepID=A0A2A9NK31_9AGAR|nr:hypothetical protein AMATHDRAFT_60111 [Amanita thiersii Skay4041]
MSDGSRLRQSWYAALNNAETHFRQLLTSSNWKRLPQPQQPGEHARSSSRSQPFLSASALPDLSNVIVHRCDDVLRLVLDLPLQSDHLLSLEPWKAVLATPELRQDWDPAVEDAHFLEFIDPYVRICKTRFTLGWPANPRDAVTISRTFHDPTTLIDISTSLPRSPDEPAYLRPSPPYVRSHVALFAWCIQRIHNNDHPSHSKLRITCFWQHDLKSLWSYSLSSSALHQQLCTMVVGLFKTVLKRGASVPKLAAFGDGIAIHRVRYQVDREALTVDYGLVPSEDQQDHQQRLRMTSLVEYVLPSLEGWDVQLSTKASSEDVERLPWIVQAIKRRIPTVLGNTFADVIILRVTHEPLRGDHQVLKVHLVIEVSPASRGVRLNGVLQSLEDEEGDQRSIQPSIQEGDEEMLRDVESATGISIVTSSSSVATGQSMSTVGSGGSGTTVAPSMSMAGGVPGRPGERTVAAMKSVLSRVRRNYIYFSSLLQEPEAKWRQTIDARGVAITQLDSIDPTLVVYRAEATFVGVGLWDLYGAVVSAGARGYWDKSHDDAVLLEDLNGLTELWHFKTKPAWPVNGRDTVVLKTVYKSPTSIHVFSFSADADPHLFPNNRIPPVDPNVIRTQVDLQGWAIESLSPTTTLLTLLEQSDMKGWTGKTSIPNQMTANVAGIGEFAIKSGGPPVVTRLSGARKTVERFDWEKASFRVVYEAVKPSPPRPSSYFHGRGSPLRTKSGVAGGDGAAGATSSPTESSSEGANGNGDSNGSNGVNEMIECEIRCDLDTWAASLDIVVDPPPQGISCLRRHKLSPEGGGLWLTLTHDPVYPSSAGGASVFLTRHRRRSTKLSMSLGSPAELLAVKNNSARDGMDEDEEGKFRVIVRRAPGREKGLVMVNGARVAVDVEEMPETEVRQAMKRKRVQPVRVPLDQPPVVGVVRRRRAEWGEGGEQGRNGAASDTSSAGSRSASADGKKEKHHHQQQQQEQEQDTVAVWKREWASAPKAASPLSRWWTYAVEQAVMAANTVVPAGVMPTSGGLGVGGAEGGSSPLPSKQKWPMQYAFEALAWVVEEYAEDRLGANLVSVGGSGGARPGGGDVTGSGTSSGTPAGVPSAPPSGTTPDGWTFVGEKVGVGVYRKMMTEVSPVVPVHRGTKIIEGVSAEELAGVILQGSCRKEWDDRFECGRVFESFGWGCETGFWVMKGGFPFRARGLYLARVVARPGGNGGSSRGEGSSRVVVGRAARSASLRGTGSLMKSSTGWSENGGDNGNGNGRGRISPGTIFIVNASYSGESESVARFSTGKYNEYALPIGRVYVDAWVLETLDPYDTREIDVAIPSTRCTRVVAVDLRGSVPAAVNGMVNVGMVRAIGALGEWVGKRLRAKQEGGSPIGSNSTSTSTGASGSNTGADNVSGFGIAVPCVRLPGGGVLLRERREDVEGLDRKGVAWSVRVRDGRRVLVKERFAIEERVFRCLMLVSVNSVFGVDPTTAAGGSGGREKEDRLESRAKSPVPGPSSSSSSRIVSTSAERRDQPSSPGAGGGNSSRNGSPGEGPTTGSTDSVISTPRGRSTFTALSQLRGGLRHATDMLVAELVIDSKMYPDGYDVVLLSRMRSQDKVVTTGDAASAGGGDGKCIALRDGVMVVKGTDDAGLTSQRSDANAMATTSVVSLLDAAAAAAVTGTGSAATIITGSGATATGSTTTTTATAGATTSGQDEQQILPLGYTVHTMPSSPMHSSGLAAESPMRHLVRLTLPTAQYQIQTVEDPLTGEMRSAPPKPSWLVEMEEGGSAVVEVEVRPRKEKSFSSKKKGVVVVRVNGGEVGVENEKESLTSLGREELVDDRVVKMPVLTMVPNEAEALPEMLRAPLAFADDLLEPAAIRSSTLDGRDPKVEEGKAAPEPEPSGEGAGTGGDGAPAGRVPSQANTGGLLGFLHNYPNPLTRFASGSLTGSNNGLPSTGGGNATSASINSPVDAGAGVKAKLRQVVPGGLGDLNVAPVSTPRTYPLSMILIVALIAFLIGSLLRSLLSPADFIYVVRDLEEAEGVGFVGGWREIRRLFEVKYLVGGWDLQIAVVRRH